VDGPFEALCGALGQRVSRCSVCLPQFGQNLFIVSRSGSLRRFLFVM
jgi:hypothetical protein